MNNNKEFSLIELEDNYIVRSTGLTRHRPGLYPSEASVEYHFDGRNVVLGKCMRAAWYRSMEIGTRKQVSPGLMMKANIGKWDEQGLIDRWKEMGIWYDNNVKFYNRKYFISGELDGIIVNPKTGNLIGVEVKSFYGYNANKEITGAKRDQIPGVPKDTHFLQAILYAWEYREELEEFRLYYVERGDGHRVEFRIGFEELSNGQHQVWWQQVDGKYWNFFSPDRVLQPYTIEDIYHRYSVLLQKIKNKELPAKEFSSRWDDETVEWMWKHKKIGKTKYEAWKKNPSKNHCGDWHCSYCDYEGQCMQDELTATQ